jgi:tetratricopeptide (TPR) repeat protein
LHRLAEWLRQSPAHETIPTGAANRNALTGGVLQAALTAEGIEAAQANLYARRIDVWADELDGLSDDPSARAVAALKLLHRRVLKHYDSRASSVAGALDEGRYNCLGSVILFAALAERLGLSCRAVERPGHVLVRLKIKPRSIDVETTTAQGVDLPRTTADAGSDERELSHRALLALVYFNRGCDLLERRAFRAALVANLTALELDPDNARARNNLLAAWNNWALALARQGARVAATELLTQGFELAPAYRLFADNLQAIGTLAP